MALAVPSTLLEALWTDILRVPPTSARVPFDIYTFFAYVLPPCLFYQIVAVLVILPGTRMLRIALWPLIVFLALRVVMFVDFSCGNPQWSYLNVGCVMVMFCVVVRTLDWAFVNGPLKRPVRPAPSFVVDAIDLTVNVRGVGWNWSKGIRFPPDTRPSSRLRFAVYTLLSALYHSFICGILHIAVQAFSPETLTVLSGGTIFDDTLPPLIRYARSSIISIVAAFLFYADIQTHYDIGTFIGVAVFQQDPAQWPPLFDAPWKATSLHEFWGYRWHQLVRRTFIVLGGRPLGFVFGRVGYVTGSFLASGVLHNVMLATLSQSAEWWTMLLSFGMMALGIIVERMFMQMTGRRVGGWIGRVWTMAWLLVWGNSIVDGFARAGLFACWDPFITAAPAKWIVDHYVTALDRWLRARAS
ncbi:hypothetical protein BKA82DRAFT_4125575 [Pisolithus tinctorius]|nr:hypothetical protein BKA82DRAFT_4125575 [Pisolithus tinctorius]